MVINITLDIMFPRGRLASDKSLITVSCVHKYFTRHKSSVRLQEKQQIIFRGAFLMSLEAACVCM